MRSRSGFLLIVAGTVVSHCGDMTQDELNAATGGGGTGGESAASGAGGMGGISVIDAGAGGAGAFEDAGVEADAPPDVCACSVAKCVGKVFECGNCIDDDGDGRIDMDDPDCLSVCDASEGLLSFLYAYPHSEDNCYLRCQFGCGGFIPPTCNWLQKCDPLEPNAKCAHDPTNSFCAEQQGPDCRADCLPMVPNGCDCFGCCELPAGSGKFVWLTSGMLENHTCGYEDLADPTKCRPCTPVPSCFNPCEDCELCLGRDTLPLGCSDVVCKPGQMRCGACEPCAEGSYCLNGCCTKLHSWCPE